MIIPIYELKYNEDRLPCLSKVREIDADNFFYTRENIVALFEKAFDISNLVEEIKVMLCFDCYRKPIGLFKLSHGTTAKTYSNFLAIIKRLILIEAYSYVVAHNHPSGDLNPSKADIQNSIELKSIGIHMLCEMKDDLVIANHKVASILDIINKDEEECDGIPVLNVVYELLRTAYKNEGYTID